jgi:hypothetical protein
MSGRPTAEQVAGWADEVEAVGERIGRHFARSEPRRRAVGYVRGLLSDADRENGCNWPSTSATRPRTGSSTCSPGPTGTPTPSATT